MKLSWIFASVMAISAASVAAQDQASGADEAAAEPKSRTRSVEGPRGSATRTTTFDREQGIFTREGSITNNATGNSASRSLTRQRTETGSTLDISRTGPRGNQAVLSGERVRGENGSTFNGTATGRQGNTVQIEGQRSRDGAGNRTRTQTVRNDQGEVLGSRSRTSTPESRATRRERGASRRNDRQGARQTGQRANRQGARAGRGARRRPR